MHDEEVAITALLISTSSRRRSVGPSLFQTRCSFLLGEPVLLAHLSGVRTLQHESHRLLRQFSWPTVHEASQIPRHSRSVLPTLLVGCLLARPDPSPLFFPMPFLPRPPPLSTSLYSLSSSFFPIKYSSAWAVVRKRPPPYWPFLLGILCIANSACFSPNDPSSPSSREEAGTTGVVIPYQPSRRNVNAHPGC